MAKIETLEKEKLQEAAKRLAKVLAPKSRRPAKK